MINGSLTRIVLRAFRSCKYVVKLTLRFRQAFAHRYHPDIVEQIAQGLIEIDEASGAVNDEVAALLSLSAEDEAGSVVAASTAFYHNGDETELDVDVSDEILDVFENTFENACAF